MKSFILNSVFTLIWIITVILFSVIIYKITISSSIEVKQLLVPLGVLVSAGLASISVVKSIHNTNKIEENKNIKRIDNTNKYLKILISNFSKELDIFNYILDTKAIFNSYNKSDIANNILSEETFDNLKDFYHSEDNKLLIGQIQSLIMFLKNITYKLEDKDIIYYAQYNEDKMYEVLRNTLIVIEVLESILNNVNKNKNIDIQKYMLKIAGLGQYINVLQKIVNNFYTK